MADMTGHRRIDTPEVFCLFSKRTGASGRNMFIFLNMNYSSLFPVLNSVMITVLALIEVAPARIGFRHWRERAIALKELPQKKKATEVRSERVADVVLIEVSQNYSAHGYSATLHLNSE